MHAFDPTENAPSLRDAAEVRVAAITITGELNAPEPDAACIVSEIQGDIDGLEKETARDRETIIATRAEQERRTVAVPEQAWPEELRRALEGAPYELSLVNSPILILPYELIAEIFDWHMFFLFFIYKSGFILLRHGPMIEFTVTQSLYESRSET